MTDVLVVGAGPSGRAAAHRCAAAGASVTLVDPRPDRRWINTYGMWTDEIPDWVPESTRASTSRSPVVVGTRRHVVDREYSVLDTGRLQDGLTLDGVSVVAESAAEVTPTSMTLRNGTTLSGRTVIDARGSAVGPGVPEQTAHGVVVDEDTAARACGGESAVIMDWRRDNGADADAVPSFLYVVPLGGGAVLLEETCLVGRPGLTSPELARRLLARLAARGVTLRGDEPVERVRFAMRPPTRPTRGVVTTGTRSPALHTATGYSVAASLRRADVIASVVLDGGGVDSAGSRAVTRLRSVGADALLSFPPDALAPFFDRFFEMPSTLQRAYLSSDDDVAGMSRAMLTLFSRIGSSDRRVILGAVRRAMFSAAVGTRS
ncbi:lycopene cyclase family protein [Rhodococcus sp. NBC_00294]|uniref:lycopene cyclase family protein n=1 Tax=Rhodococcus sp. NBC_00294 TaxID=2976004 RepID=UPI002E28A419|nr:lycopene cyclase family protein [Rhodococcus sp. NBC_00294]